MCREPSEIGKDRIVPQFSGKQVTVWKEYFYYYLFDICDYYQILPDIEFNNDNVEMLFREQRKRNEMLRQEQKEQEEKLSRQEQEIRELKQRIVDAGKGHLLT